MSTKEITEYITSIRVKDPALADYLYNMPVQEFLARYVEVEMEVLDDKINDWKNSLENSKR